MVLRWDLQVVPARRSLHAGMGMSFYRGKPDLAALLHVCHITPLHRPADLAGAHQGDARGAQEHVPAELLRD